MTTTKRRFVDRAVDRVSARLGRRDVDRPGLTRRSFLVRTAVVGSALTIAPLRWMVRPTSAYASVCGEGAACNQGWTAFCCTINDGANTCPPGSFVAGWWKIDRSPFCDGAPRYIIDCNRSPGSSCRCRCASGTCDQRRVCCNVFRYGQCNTQIGGVTEVVCRVVVCTAPWVWDPACGRTVRTDNRTRTHNAPCLYDRDSTLIERYYQDLGLNGSELGSPVGSERSGPRGGAWQVYDHGVITWHSSVGLLVLRDVIADRYVDLDGPSGALGYPRDEGETIDGEATRTRFERGAMYGVGDDAFAVFGPAAARYEQLDGPGGTLGAPTVGTEPVGDGRGSVTRFEHGDIYAAGQGAQAVQAPYLATYEELGGPADGPLGYPIAPPEDDQQRFARGVLIADGDGALVLWGPIADRYLALDGPDGPWGPLQESQTSEAGVDVARFAEATVFASGSIGAKALDGPVLETYLDQGGPAGDLGAPTTDRFGTRTGQQRAGFEHGAIELDPGASTPRVERFRTTRDVSDLTTGA